MANTSVGITTRNGSTVTWLANNKPQSIAGNGQTSTFVSQSVSCMVFYSFADAGTNAYVGLPPYSQSRSNRIYVTSVPLAGKNSGPIPRCEIVRRRTRERSIAELKTNVMTWRSLIPASD